MGWALKVSKVWQIFSSKQTDFLRSKFQIGEQTGYKQDPADVCKDMRLARNEDVNRILSTDEYLTAQQITHLFSREAKRRRVVTNSDDEHDGVQEANIAGICATVSNGLLVCHPLTFDEQYFDILRCGG